MLATYVNASTFTVEDEYDQLFVVGRAVLLLQGDDGPVTTYVDSASYDHETNLTTVVVDDAVVTANLVSVERGSSSPASVAKHLHPEIAASILSEAQVDELLSARYQVITAGENLDPFDVCYADSAESGKVKKAQADGTEIERDVRFMVRDASILDNAEGNASFPGLFVTNPAWSWTPGVWLYLSDTPGDLSETPGTNEVRVAFSVTATSIFFFPVSQAVGISWIEDTFANRPSAGEEGRFFWATDEHILYRDNGATWDKRAVIDYADLEGAPASPINPMGAWVTSTDYDITPAIDLVENNGSSYLCISAHTSGASTEPGIGASWETVWMLLVEPAAGGGGPAPDYTPPAIIWKDADEIYVPPGRYFKAGYRHKGQYQDLVNLGTYWDVAAQTAVDVDGTYAAGTTSGMIDAAKVNSSWYSLFLMAVASGTPIILALPYVRIKALSYSAPDTIIEPADHDTGLAAANGFFTADDAWNTYRMVLKKIEAPTYDGNLYTIADTVNGTPDQIRVTGDKTAEMAVTDWIQLIPPAGTACLYLGTVRIDGSGNLLQFKKTDWLTVYNAQILLNAYLHASNFGNSEIGSAVPPGVGKTYLNAYISSEATAVTQVIGRVAFGSSDNIYDSAFNGGASGTYMKASSFMILPMLVTQYIRSKFNMYGAPAAASLGQLQICGWEE